VTKKASLLFPQSMSAHQGCDWAKAKSDRKKMQKQRFAPAHVVKLIFWGRPALQVNNE